MPHHAFVSNFKKFLPKSRQEISITQDLFGCREKHREKKRKKKFAINLTQTDTNTTILLN